MIDIFCRAFFCSFLFLGIAIPLFGQEGSFIVRFGSPQSQTQRRALIDHAKAELQTRLPNGMEVWKAGNLEEAQNYLVSQAAIEAIEPNYSFSISALPNDPMLYEQWGLRNVGQYGGQNGMDIGAEQAWDRSTTSNAVAGIIDTGIDYHHEDLGQNIWQNLAEDADGDGKVLEWDGNKWIMDPDDLNGLDDDNNGYIDDLIGWDFVNNDNDPFDDNSHGTHVAGIIGARGNNNIGISGVVWETKMMALKAFGRLGGGSLSSILPALEYARNMGADLTNNSWGGSVYSEFLYEEIAEAEDAGQLFVAAAGNEGITANHARVFPANYDLDNIIAVGASMPEDDFAYFSNASPIHVDLAAPGWRIMSTLPNHQYGFRTGTSMAAPMVSGAILLMKSIAPSLSPMDLKAHLLERTRSNPQYSSLCVSGGSVDLRQLLGQLNFNCQEWAETAHGQDVLAMAESDHALWIGTAQNGLIEVLKNGCGTTRYDSANSPLTTDRIQALLVGNDQSLWIATDQGLWKKQDQNWQLYHPSNSNIASANLLCLLEDEDGTIWIGSNAHGLLFGDGQSWDRYDTGNSQLPNDKVCALYEDHTGGLWIGTQSGLVRKTNHNWQVYLPAVNTFPTGPIRSISGEASGAIWLGTDNGLSRFDQNVWLTYNKNNSPLPTNGIKHLAFDAPKGLWIATDSGLVTLHNNAWRTYDAEGTNLQSTQVNLSLHASLENSFVGTAAGYDLFSPDLLVGFDGPDRTCVNTEKHYFNTSLGLGPNATFLWRLNGQAISTAADLRVAFSQVGLHQLSLSVHQNGITDSANQYIRVTEKAFIDLGDEINVCADAFLLNAENPNFEYVWKRIECAGDSCPNALDYSQLDSIIFRQQGGYTIGYEYQFMLTDTAEKILEINTEYAFAPRDSSGTYGVFLAFYDPPIQPSGIAIGSNINDISFGGDTCAGITEPLWLDLYQEEFLSTSPWLQADRSGTYVVEAIDACGNTATDTIKLTLTNGCVWPGDANADGVVNGVDFLVVGIANQQNGTLRPNASTNWQSESSPDWPQLFDSLNVLAPALNLKHADTDGNGIISLEDDGAVVAQNFNFLNPINFPTDSGGLVLTMEHLSTVFTETNVAYIEIGFDLSGPNGSPVEDLYGLTYNLNFSDPLSEAPQFYPEPNGWFNQLESLVGFLDGSNVNNIVPLVPADKRKSSFSLVSDNRTNASGIGRLGKGGIIVTLEDLADDPELLGFSSITISTESMIAVDSLGRYLPASNALGNHSLTIDIYWPSGNTFPLEWLEFQVNQRGNDALLEWTTVQEENTDHFIVERSVDGLFFGPIGYVEAQGKAGQQSYIFPDKEIMSKGFSQLYYRLKQVDLDGQFTYSDRVLLSPVQDFPILLLAYPNPTESMMTLEWNAPAKVQEIRITNGLGKELYLEKGPLPQRKGDWQIDFSDWPAGVYFIRVATELQSAVQKIWIK